MVYQALLEAGANPIAPDVRGMTPLHYAYTDEAVRDLVAAGASVNAQALRGITPLMVFVGGKYLGDEIRDAVAGMRMYWCTGFLGDCYFYHLFSEFEFAFAFAFASELLRFVDIDLTLTSVMGTALQQAAASLYLDEFVGILTEAVSLVFFPNCNFFSPKH